MPTLSKILAPVVFSPQCEHSTRYAAALACHSSSELILLHVFTPSGPLIAGPECYVPIWHYDEAQTLANIHARLDAFLDNELRGIRVRREVRDGDAAEVIVALSQAESCDLVVMPTHGYGLFRRLLLGSVTAKVLHDVRCPVLTGPHLEEAPAKMPSFRTIQCAIDLGPQSYGVIEWGSWLAGQFGSQLDVVHVVPDHRAHLEGIDFDPQWRNQMIAGATHRFDDLQRAWNTNYAIHVECGDVPQTLWKTAEVAAADLMVIGRGHHDGALGRLRSNAYAILREAPCPVIAI